MVLFACFFCGDFVDTLNKIVPGYRITHEEAPLCSASSSGKKMPTDTKTNSSIYCRVSPRVKGLPSEEKRLGTHDRIVSQNTQASLKKTARFSEHSPIALYSSPSIETKARG